MNARLPELGHVDRAAFLSDVDALHARLVADLGPADLRHLRGVIRISRACAVGGYLSATIAGVWLGLAEPGAGVWLAAAPAVVLAMVLMSLGTYSRWIVMHHVGHRGYDKVPGAPPHLTSRRFARGARRYLDWLDWMTPEAWIHEHNLLHHGRTGEEADPDLVERNALILREWRAPRLIKLLAVGVASVTWKYLYYAPNTVRELHRAQRARASRRDGEPAEEAARRLFDLRRAPGRAELARLLSPRSPEGREIWLRCWLPYVALRFGVAPLPALLLGPEAWAVVLVASLGAEALTNLHGFLTITPNHTGDDLPRFEARAHDRAEFVLRQVVGSVDYAGGDDLRDFWYGYLNYQIEHHVWADLPMLKYRQAQPALAAICARHGVPYLRQPLAPRVRKLVAVMIGEATTPVMRTADARADSSSSADVAPREGTRAPTAAASPSCPPVPS